MQQFEVFTPYYGMCNESLDVMNFGVLQFDSHDLMARDTANLNRVNR